MIENVTGIEDAQIPFPDLVNLYHCTLGFGTFVGPFVEIQRDVITGALCKIESHGFLCTGVTIGDRVFVGHGVMFCNDLFPAIDAAPVRLFQTTVEDDVVIGSGATILPVRIGRGAVIGAGAVVTDHVPHWSLVVGNPGRVVMFFTGRSARNEYFAKRKRDNLQPVQRQRSRD